MSELRALFNPIDGLVLQIDPIRLTRANPNMAIHWDNGIPTDIDIKLSYHEVLSIIIPLLEGKVSGKIDPTLGKSYSINGKEYKIGEAIQKEYEDNITLTFREVDPNE